MKYYLDIFSPETYQAFSESTKTVSGIRESQLVRAKKVQIGDKLICYVTKLSRWIGILEVKSLVYKDEKPIFSETNDQFIMRFDVEPLVWLTLEESLPIKNDLIWNNLSFTRGKELNDGSWTGRFRGSLSGFNKADGDFLEKALLEQKNQPLKYPLSKIDKKKLNKHEVKRENKIVLVSIPESNSDEDNSISTGPRESLKVQAKISDIGIKMGMKIWLPANDKNAVAKLMLEDTKHILTSLPINFDNTTLRTIENIDVLWLKKRTIIRAFEVEHTTSIYSGILRMADLISLQPNLDIKIHIVAPEQRKEKVFQEVRRPVFALLEKGPLEDICTYISYKSINEICKTKHLQFMNNEFLDEYTEDASSSESY